MVKILNFSPHNEDCGIAKYQEQYVSALNDSDQASSDFFEYSPYQTRSMGSRQFDEVVQSLKLNLVKYDILHIQHEFGFFRGNQLEKLVKAAKSLGKKVVVSYHTSPDLIIIKKPLEGFSPRNVLSFLRSYRHNYLLSKAHIYPLNLSDRVLVHNNYTRNSLVDYGVTEDKIALLPHPTYSITAPKKTTTIAKALNKNTGDIIISCIGYLHRFKGVDKAIKSLSFLPSNYKLAILGGVKSDSDDQTLYDSLTDLVVERGLKDRVYITGVVLDDDLFNSYIRETDVCFYPYDSKYYKGVASGALNLAIANERPIIAYPVSTFVETNTKFGHIAFTNSDSYYELARELGNTDLTKQKAKITAYAKANSWLVLSRSLLEIYSSL